MGEAKRKRYAEIEAQPHKKDWATGIAIIAVALVAITPILLETKFLGNSNLGQEAKTTEIQVAGKSASKAPVATKTQARLGRRVIDTAEGFIQRAQELSSSQLPVDWEQATTFWKGAIGKDRGNLVARKGYAKSLIQVLLYKNKMQPARALPHQLMQEARSACTVLIMRASQDPLSHELSAYCEALHGNQEGALMSASQAGFAAQRAGVTRASHDLMSKIILISSQRRKRQGVGVPNHRPSQPHIPGIPR